MPFLSLFIKISRIEHEACFTVKQTQADTIANILRMFVTFLILWWIGFMLSKQIHSDPLSLIIPLDSRS